MEGFSQVKASILNRPMRCNTPDKQSCMTTTTERQYAEEQALLQARRNKKEQSQARLLGALYPTRASKHQRQEELRAQEDAFLAARVAEKNRQVQEDTAWQAPVFKSAQAGRVAAAVPCWSAAVSGVTLEQQAAARSRQMAEQARVKNAQLIAEHLRQEAERARREAEIERRPLQAEAGFFNLGAASEHWIAPEHRMLHGQRPRSAQRRPAPWALHE